MVDAKMRWSLSALKLYERCGAQYDYRYNQKLPSDAGPAANRGTEQHALIETFIKVGGELAPELDFYTLFLRDIRAYRDGAILPEHQLAVDQDWKPVLWDDPKAWARGILDLLLLPETGCATVYDWKTGKMYDDHFDQKELYAAFVLSCYPTLTEVESVHTYLDLKKNTTRVYHISQLAAVQQKWTERAGKMEQKDYTPTPGWHCKWCSYSRGKGGLCKF